MAFQAMNHGLEARVTSSQAKSDATGGIHNLRAEGVLVPLQPLICGQGGFAPDDWGRLELTINAGLFSQCVDGHVNDPSGVTDDSQGLSPRAQARERHPWIRELTLADPGRGRSSQVHKGSATLIRVGIGYVCFQGCRPHAIACGLNPWLSSVIPSGWM